MLAFTSRPFYRPRKQRLLVLLGWLLPPRSNGRIRGDYASYPIEFITELPRIKQARGVGAGGRRRRPYGDIGVTMVDEGYLPPAAAFRDAGNQSLFRFERRSSACGKNNGAASADTIVEATLRSVRESNDRAAKSASTSAAKAADARGQDLTFMTTVEGQEEEGGEEREEDEGEADRGLGLDQGGAGGMCTRLLRGPVDPMVRGDPVKLRMALTALRYTLKHPVTSSMDVPWQKQQKQQQQQQQQQQHWSKDKDSGVGRKTAAARARQLPRRPYRLFKGPHQPGFCAGLLDGPAKKGGGGGRGGLGRVDEVSREEGARCFADS